MAVPDLKLNLGQWPTLCVISHVLKDPRNSIGYRSTPFVQVSLQSINILYLKVKVASPGIA
jgi:hypothetical protein